jgi:hypothetical protein
MVISGFAGNPYGEIHLHHSVRATNPCGCFTARLRITAGIWMNMKAGCHTICKAIAEHVSVIAS